jgi:hypothetical protein
MSENDPPTPAPRREADPAAPDELLEEVLEAELVLEEEEAELVDGLPVLAGSRQPILAPKLIPPVQAAAVAATSFIAGAAALALLRRGGVRRLGRELSDLRELRDRYEATRRSPAPLGMVPGQSYLIQIRVLGRPPGGPGD